MKETGPEHMVVGDKSGIDLSESQPSLQAQLNDLEKHLEALPADCAPIERARIQLDIAETLLGLQKKKESWDIGRKYLMYSLPRKHGRTPSKPATSCSSVNSPNR